MRGFKMILSHMAPSCLDMSSYRAIWTRFRPNVIFCWPKNLRSWSKNPRSFLNCKSPHLAILINIWHIREDGSQKVNNDEPDLGFFHGNVWPVISQAVRKNLSERGCMGSTFSQKYSKLAVCHLCKNSLFVVVKIGPPHIWTWNICGQIDAQPSGSLPSSWALNINLPGILKFRYFWYVFN